MFGSSSTTSTRRASVTRAQSNLREGTDTQRDQIKTIGDSHKDEGKALADRERASCEAVNDAINGDTIDDGVIRQKSAEAAFVDADMAVARGHARVEVFQILTAEQKAKVKEMRSRRSRV